MVFDLNISFRLKKGTRFSHFCFSQVSRGMLKQTRIAINCPFRNAPREVKLVQKTAYLGALAD